MVCFESKHVSREDAGLDKITNFVHFALLGDLANLQHLLRKEKMDPNAQDVGRRTLVRGFCCCHH